MLFFQIRCVSHYRLQHVNLNEVTKITASRGGKNGNKDWQLFERWERESNSANVMGQLLMGSETHYPSGPYLMTKNMGLVVWACYVEAIQVPTEFFCFIARI